ncbi:MAG: hypothetical protein B7Y80_14155 [Hyphomicrobium sp. 32-62-53]|nr:MAG: hypothetical protein B7Z29_07710 [Hyphomicrobium sp. 12-62-95]OYX98847.1 MAG: hypothetical protein B7Y80_14155 [Hyphomicrobium sp. 32-62-53]
MQKATDLEFGFETKLPCRQEGLIQRRLKIGTLVAMAGLVTCIGNSLPARAADNPFHKTAFGIEAYLGLMPAAIIRGHPAAHPEATMHGGPPNGQYKYHLVVALFDASTRQRISNAAVKARISELGLGGSDLALEPMTIAETISYGGFVSFRSAGRYVIRIDVERPGSAPVSMEFSYTSQPP